MSLIVLRCSNLVTLNAPSLIPVAPHPNKLATHNLPILLIISFSATVALFLIILQPTAFVDWRGRTWGPVNLLTWFGLSAAPYANLSRIAAARRGLCRQSVALLMKEWR